MEIDIQLLNPKRLTIKYYQYQRNILIMEIVKIFYPDIINFLLSKSIFELLIILFDNQFKVNDNFKICQFLKAINILIYQIKNNKKR